MGRKKLLNNHQVLQAIQSWIIDHGSPPTLEELKNALGVGSKRTVQRYLEQLKEEGYIDRWSGARGIRLRRVPTSDTATRAIPVVGEVSAGSLNFTEEHVEAWLRVPEMILKPKSQKFFLLRVRGDSMNKASVEDQSIEEGDLLLVRKQSIANSGEIVVAMVDGETTVKRLLRGHDFWVLKPESNNPIHQPIMLNSELVVQGIVTRVIKGGSTYLTN